MTVDAAKLIKDERDLAAWIDQITGDYPDDFNDRYNRADLACQFAMDYVTAEQRNEITAAMREVRAAEIRLRPRLLLHRAQRDLEIQRQDHAALVNMMTAAEERRR